MNNFFIDRCKETTNMLDHPDDYIEDYPNVLDKKLFIPGQRYWFMRREHFNGNRIFRANYKNLSNIQLFVDKYSDRNNCLQNNRCLWAMPSNWIGKIMTLDEITFYKLKLPVELVRLIDAFL